MSDPLTPIALDELERLYAAATEGRWSEHEDVPRSIVASSEPNVNLLTLFTPPDDISYAVIGSKDDHAAIVALHNAAPALIAAARAIQGHRAECHEIDQTLGRALGYPLAPGSDVTVCTGDHTPATLALAAAREMEALRAERDELAATLANERGEGARVVDERDKARAEVGRLSARDGLAAAWCPTDGSELTSYGCCDICGYEDRLGFAMRAASKAVGDE